MDPDSNGLSAKSKQGIGRVICMTDVVRRMKPILQDTMLYDKVTVAKFMMAHFELQHVAKQEGLS